MKSKYSLFILPVLCLASCSKASFAGKYSFLLGREGGDGGDTKIGLTMELSDDEFTYKKNQTINKYFAKKADMLAYDKTKLKDGDLICVYQDETKGDEINYYVYITSTDSFEDRGAEQPKVEGKVGKKLSASAELTGSFGDMPKEISDAISKGIKGYYIETNYVDERYGTRLHLGTFPNEENIPGLEDIYKYIANHVSSSIADAIKFLVENFDSVIDDKLLEYALCTYCDSTTVTLLAPVSFGDLQQQLAWYGKYIDFDDELMSKIHSLKDLVDVETLLKLISTTKRFDLTEHRTKITGQPMSEGEIVKMPGKEGEERFGSEPLVDKDVSPVIDQVDLMNKTYANEFSNTFLYEDSACTKVIGAFTTYNKTAEGASKQMYYYYDRENKLTTSDASISGYVLQKDEDDLYKKSKEVKVSLVHSFTDPNLGIQIGNVSDTLDKVIEYNTFLKKPFTFRVFHRLPLTLKK